MNAVVPIAQIEAQATPLALSEAPAALPAPAQFDVVTDLIRSVLGVPAVSIALHGAPGGVAPGLYRAFLETPLIAGDETIGALRILDTQERRFTDRDCTLLEGFARLIVDQVELWSEASRDMLTQAMTRRAFVDAMRKTHALRQRRPIRAGLIAFDLDHFKRINDTLGHAAGDDVLRAVAGVVRRELRTVDSFGRLGGEEFGVIVSDANATIATEVAARIRRAIEVAEIPGQPGLRVTASLGVAELSDTLSRAEDWLAAADAASYRAKSEGRNRVCLAEVARPVLC